VTVGSINAGQIVTTPRVNTPITKVPGATFPLGRVYVPTINIKPR
jgi:hypothetical protein